MQEILESWNEIINCFLHAEELWKEHRERMRDMREISVEPAGARRALALSLNRAKFDVAAERLINLAVQMGGFEFMLVDIPATMGEVKEEEEPPEEQVSPEEEVELEQEEPDFSEFDDDFFEEERV